MIKSTKEADSEFDEKFGLEDVGYEFDGMHQSLDDQDCYPKIKSHTATLRKQDIMSLMKDVEGKYEMAKTTKQFMQRSIRNETLDEVKALLEKNLKLL
jgi:hypothetical protein